MKIFNFYKKNNKVCREQWIKKSLLEIPNNSMILDAGAGELQYKKFCDHLRYVSQDFGKYDGVGDKNGLQTGQRDNTKLDIVSDIIDMPVNSNTYDAIMCIEVFEHIPEPILAIKEFSRIIKKNGILILTAPVSSFTHYSPYYFYNGFSKYFFNKFLVENGFKIEELSFNGNYFDYLFSMLIKVPDVLNKYVGFGGIIFKYIYILIITPLLIIINFASKKDKGSCEFHSTGIHVLARKE